MVLINVIAFVVSNVMYNVIFKQKSFFYKFNILSIFSLERSKLACSRIVVNKNSEQGRNASKNPYSII